jgi:hypothetical protein
VESRRDPRLQVVEGDGHYGHRSEQHANQRRDPAPHRLRFLRGVAHYAGIGPPLGLQGIFGDEIVFVQPQVAPDGSNKPAVKDAPGKLVPLLILKGFQEPRRDPRGGRHLFQGHTPKLTLAF